MTFLRPLLSAICLLAATFIPVAAENTAPNTTQNDDTLVELKLELPYNDVESKFYKEYLPDMEQDLHKPRPPLFIPKNANHNIARGKPVTSSSRAVVGELNYATDGDKDAAEGYDVELEPGVQWLQIDLQKRSEIFAIALWHFHRKFRVYRNVIVQISDDPRFEYGVTTVFNTDHENALKLGAGKDKRYVDTEKGKLIEVAGIAGRYVRFYSEGDLGNKGNHYVEVEIYGRDARIPAAPAPTSATTDWLSAANARIEQHRKDPLIFSVTRNGRPVPGARIEVAMLRHEFLFGCNIFKWGTCSTPEQNDAYSHQFAALFNFATLPFYWWGYEHTQDNTTASRAQNERIAAWCAENGIRAKGHPLAWNFREPGWTRDMDAAEIQRRQLKHVADGVNQFAGKIAVWDVVNEAAEWNRAACRKQAPHLTANIAAHGGPAEYVKTCFATARKAIPAGAPAPLLLINDYQTTEPYENLLKQLNDPNGTPIYDAIGIQSHMHSHVWGNEELWKTYERFAAFAKPIHFTELTIMSTSPKFSWSKKTDPDPENGEALQRDNVARIYTLLFSLPSVEAVTWWDFSDQGAWQSVPAGLLRADMTPKPAYLALKKLIREDWATNITLTTNDIGTVSTRAFRGEYRFTVMLPDGSKVNREFSGVVKKGANVIKLELD